MKIFIAIILVCLIQVFSSCGGCSGYGGFGESDDYLRKPSYLSFLVLRDPTDTMRIISYEVKSDTVFPNKVATDFKLPFLTSTFVYVKTDRQNYRFRIFLPVTYSYWEDKKCDRSDVDFTVSYPNIDEVSGGIIYHKRTELLRPTDIKDSIFLSQ